MPGAGEDEARLFAAIASEPSHDPGQPFAPWSFSLLAVGVGVAGAVGALVFRRLIALVHNLVFLGELSTVYDANQHTPASPWGAWIIAGPVLAAVVVAWLIERFAPEARGHGVPEVMDAVFYKEGRIRPRVAVVKSLASALSIGSGGAVGREGPIVQIAASVGSALGQALRIPVWQRITLIAAGAGAGIAATFNTPLGGVLFAVEIILHEISVRTLVPVVIATATAAYCGQFFFGPNPSFVIPALEGGAYGVLLERVVPGLGVHPPALAVAGMAGMVGGSIGAAMTAVVMIFEMTLDYKVIIPMTIMVATSYGVRRTLCRESIYTAKLARRGHPVPEALHANVYLMRPAREVMEEDFPVLPASASLGEAAETLGDPAAHGFLVVADDRRVRAAASASGVLRALASGGRDATLASLSGTRFVVADGGESLFELVARMRRSEAAVAVVTEEPDPGKGAGDPRPVLGLITRNRIAEVVAGSVDLFSGEPRRRMPRGRSDR